MRWAALMLLAACSLPDRVGVSSNASQYDYFASSQGGLNQWPFANDTGYGYGVGVWAEWDIGTPERAVTFEWPANPPYYLATPRETIVPMPIQAEKVEVEGDHVETFLKAGDRMSGWSPMMQFGGMLCLILVVGVFVRRYLNKQKDKP